MSKRLPTGIKPTTASAIADTMDEKHLPGPPRRPKQKRRAAHLAVAAIALCWAAWRLASFSLHACRRHDGLLLSYPGESIKWKPCGQVDDHDLECSDIDVPMDQFDPQNSGDKTFSIPLVRMRGKNATQNLLLNPGGPGGSGVGFVYGQGAEISAVVGEDFHLLSFDPRGVNASRPLASCYPDRETRESKANPSDADPVHDSPSRYAWTKNYVRACAENMGEHGRYIDTPQTAADMNSILDAVGQEHMVYWGFSYGSLLGQTYAALFPERASRVIIDGVVDWFEWYQSPLQKAVFTDTHRVFEGFFEECIAAGDRCALSSLADSGPELSRKVVGFMDGLREEPAVAYLNTTTYGALDYPTMWLNAVFRHLYAPSGWYQLADRLAGMMKGNATDAWLAYGFGDVFGIIGEATDIIQLNDGASGPEYWTQGRENLTDVLFPFYQESPFAFSQNRVSYAKQQWAIPKTHGFVPRNGVRTAHPLLVLSTTYDPVCPLASARVARGAFEGSRLVEVKGYGHCSLAVPSVCAAKHVRAFLLDGTLPDGDVQCEGDEPYFTRPEDSTVVARSGADETEDRIRAAQAALARDMRWLQAWW